MELGRSFSRIYYLQLEGKEIGDQSNDFSFRKKGFLQKGVGILNQQHYYFLFAAFPKPKDLTSSSTILIRKSSD
jgi:hypothetical protein